MPSRGAIKSVLHNFLGRYASRYSEYHGYFLFGFLVVDLGEVEFDLLALPTNAESPIGVAAQLATTRFADHLQHAGLELAQVREARLRLGKLSGAIQGTVNGRPRAGFGISFSASALLDNGKRYEREKVLWVAPHDPSIESRSARAT
jgi:hypothetical protein